MTTEVQLKINSDPRLISFIRENPIWYKRLNRNPDLFKEFTMDMIEKVVNDFLYPDGSSSVSVIGILLPGYGIDNATYVADFDHGVYRYTITIDATTGHIVNYERYKTIG